ncbi:sugar phosphate isomerase/epimerase family protein [Chitinophaga sp. GCM10012297]|uniref:Sugar phosphate isomerase/epimerase n=1 Tax=Chitinophaga chungangae TaxID=2821488 RepID=A0ABS3YAY9_9BACT|nr:sugar phosphate isomerase/epimerase family protein [Chitinophaga chungangae]MBO9151845.1 sugar phosphate isomerase/epimerase [Chitinophaga chungangae]
MNRLCVHTITTKPLSLEQVAEAYPKAGVSGVTVWRDALEGRDIAASGRLLRDAGLEIVSLCRGGFFPHTEPAKRKLAIADNLRAIDEAAALGAPLIVLVCGAAADQPLETSRRQIAEGIAEIEPYARAANVKLAIEPLHPMYADTRSAINTLAQANDLAMQIGSGFVGVAVDVYHLWWDPALQQEIYRCGSNGKLFAFHICDWRVPTRDLLLDRGLMGEGCIPVKQIRQWVEAAGFDGYHEVEIFSTEYWSGDQYVFLERIREAYIHHS